MPKVSVIMNCHNGEAFLADAISSVLSQTMTDFEIVFWDNMSTDRSAAIVASFGDRVRYFKSETFQTLGLARTSALAYATGQYVAILDVDDRWLPAKLEAQVRLLDQRPELALAYCDMVRINEHGARLSRWSEERRVCRGRVLEELLKSCFISISTVLIRGSVLTEVGWFDPRFTQAEEWDLYLRVAEKYEVDYIDAVLVEERVHAGNTSRDYDRVADEICMVLEEWASRAPRYRSLCRRMIDVSRFKQAGIRAYRAFRGGSFSRAAREAARCAGLALRHPIFLPRVVALYANPANRKVFGARFS